MWTTLQCIPSTDRSRSQSALMSDPLRATSYVRFRAPQDTGIRRWYMFLNSKLFGEELGGRITDIGRIYHRTPVRNNLSVEGIKLDITLRPSHQGREPQRKTRMKSHQV